MTIIHLILELLHLGHLGLVQSMCPSREGVWLLFFKPIFHRVACYSKCPRQPSQTATLLIGSYNFFTALLRISIWCRILATLLIAWFAAIFLLSIRSMSVTHQIIAPAVSAADRDCDRNHDEILLFPSSSKLFKSHFPSSLPHPPPRVTHYP